MLRAILSCHVFPGEMQLRIIRNSCHVPVMPFHPVTAANESHSHLGLGSQAANENHSHPDFGQKKGRPIKDDPVCA
tara:strand:+ start:513 stop:740 length:228 start_codon:yes stop_codon:yes gene_type:complete